jgi:hypothetical protein
MMQTLLAVVHDGRIVLSEPADLPEGTQVLVTFLPEEDRQFWTDAGQKSLDAVWNNAEDNVYAQLLEK